MELDFNLLNKLFGRIADSNEGERNVAAAKIASMLIENNVHPSELQITRHGKSVYMEFERARDIYVTEITRLQNQLRFARTKLNPGLLRALNQIGAHVDRWPEVEALLLEKFGENGNLPAHWKRILAQVAGCSYDTIGKWKNGSMAVSDSVIDRLRGAPRPTEQQNKQSRSKPVASSANRAPTYKWTPDIYMQVLCWLDQQKLTTKQVAERLGINQSQVDSKFISRGPDESLLQTPIDIHAADADMDYLELWKIGYTLFGQKWKGAIETRCSLRRRSIGFAHPSWLNAEHRERLRNEWHALSVCSSYKPRVLGLRQRKVLDRIRAAGNAGTRIDPRDASRASELKLAKLIFDSQQDDGIAIVWVASEFQESHPRAWCDAEAAIDRAAK